MPQRIKILEKARELFLTYSYSKISMNELAKNLGMSKRTLYETFTGKENLLLEIIEIFFTKISTEINNILDSNEIDFPEKIKKIISLVGTKLSEISPYFLEDISKNAPNVWNRIQLLKEKVAFNNFYTLLEEGIKKGYVKKDINKSLAVLMFTSFIETMINPNFKKQIPSEMMKELPFSIAGLVEGMMKIIFEGIEINK